jgi:hypothetical protein
VTALLWSRGSPPPMAPCQLGADIPVVGCYVPDRHGPDGGPLVCVPLSARDATMQLPACGPYLPPGAQGSAMPPCQLGAGIPIGGCYAPGSTAPDGSPLVCVLAAAEGRPQPPVCGPYLPPGAQTGAPSCQVGVQIPVGGCDIPGTQGQGPNGGSISCPPPGALPSGLPPPAECRPYYSP